MQRTDVRHKLYIHSYKIILAFLFVTAFANAVYAQNEVQMYGKYTGSKNLPYYDDKLFHFGFTIGVNTTHLITKPSAQYFANDTIKSIQSQNNPGFSLGFIVNYRLADYWDLRLLPTVAFYERDVTYKTTYTGTIIQANEAAFIELPLMLKYKSQRRKNSRMYMVGGIKPGIETGAKKER